MLRPLPTLLYLWPQEKQVTGILCRSLYPLRARHIHKTKAWSCLVCLTCGACLTAQEFFVEVKETDRDNEVIRFSSLPSASAATICVSSHSLPLSPSHCPPQGLLVALALSSFPPLSQCLQPSGSWRPSSSTPLISSASSTTRHRTKSTPSTGALPSSSTRTSASIQTPATPLRVRSAPSPCAYFSLELFLLRFAPAKPPPKPLAPTRTAPLSTSSAFHLLTPSRGPSSLSFHL